MSRIELFKRHLEEKRAVKIIAGIDNFDIENITKVVKVANQSGASAIDVSAREDIIKIAKENSSLPVFVSSVVPSELAKVASLGADAIEIGNYDAFYKIDKKMTALEILDIVMTTMKLIENEDIYVCATVPGHISIEKQIELAQKFEEAGVDLIQTEGSATTQAKSSGARGLIENALVSIANTTELVRNINIPVMCSSGLTPTTIPMAFAAGASAVGVGSCINKLESELSMIATANLVVESAKKSFFRQKDLV